MVNGTPNPLGEAERPAKEPATGQRMHRGLRLLLSSAAGLTVTILSLLSAWRGPGTHPSFRSRQDNTQYRLRTIEQAIQRHIETTGKPPSALGELQEVREGRLWVGRDGSVRDCWDRPVHYSVDGGKHLVVSYGRDGKPGGRGLDCDLSSADPTPPESLPTFGQFLLDLPTGSLVWTSVLGGVVVFLLAFCTIKKDLYATMPAGAISIAINLAVTVIAALLFASFISVLHIPTGH